jgi:hypothetical protein
MRIEAPDGITGDSVVGQPLVEYRSVAPDVVVATTTVTGASNVPPGGVRTGVTTALRYVPEASLGSQPSRYARTKSRVGGVSGIRVPDGNAGASSTGQRFSE